MRFNRLNELGKQIELAGVHSDPPAIRKRGGILTIHGINTQRHWQDDLATWVQDAGFRYSRVTYGHILKSLLPWQLNSVIARIEQRYNELRRRDLAVSAIAHSFGTLALGNYLWRKPRSGLRNDPVEGSYPGRTISAPKQRAHHVAGRALGMTAGGASIVSRSRLVTVHAADWITVFAHRTLLRANGCQECCMYGTM